MHDADIDDEEEPEAAAEEQPLEPVGLQDPPPTPYRPDPGFSEVTCQPVTLHELYEHDSGSLTPEGLGGRKFLFAVLLKIKMSDTNDNSLKYTADSGPAIRGGLCQRSTAKYIISHE